MHSLYLEANSVVNSKSGSGTVSTSGIEFSLKDYTMIEVGEWFFYVCRIKLGMGNIEI